MSSLQKPKVKLIAIAKDEAAYLPAWIFHHLRVGFESIDIYVNNTTDNTWQIAKKLKALSSVRFIDADALFQQYSPSPQDGIYRYAIDEQFNHSDHTHAMFLDIDEFWYTGTENSIIDCISKYPKNAVVGFGWFVKTNESEFSLPFENELEGYNGCWVKSCFPLSTDIERIDVHSVKLRDGRYFYADGWERDLPYYAGGVEGAARYTKDHQTLPPKNSFVIHRMFRSQMEYVSLLARVNPNDLDGCQVTFKNNRNGYRVKNNRSTTVPLSEDFIQYWENEYINFLCKYQLKDEISKAKKFIINRYNIVLNAIESVTYQDFFVLQCLLYGIEIEDVVSRFELSEKRNLAKATVYREQQRRDRALEVIKCIYEKLRVKEPRLSRSLLQLLDGSTPPTRKAKYFYSYQLLVSYYFQLKIRFIRNRSARLLDKNTVTKVINYMLKNLPILKEYDPTVAYKVLATVGSLRPNGVRIQEAFKTLSND